MDKETNKIQMTRRECPKCHKRKPADSENFYKKKEDSLGLDAYCIPCRKRRNARHYRRNRKSLKKKHLEWWNNNKARVNKGRRKNSD